MGKMADSINSLGAGLVQGFGILAQALTQNQQPQNLPVFDNLGINVHALSGIPINQYHVYEN